MTSEIIVPAQDKQKTSPKDVFLHLLAILTLYASGVSFGALLFQYIDIWMPDRLQDMYWVREGALSAIRFSIASLVIVFPVYLLTTRFLNRTYFENPSRRNMRIRKWLVYFTVFATALVIIGDLVSLVYNLLGGETTARFLLKTLTVFFVAGSIFFYYFWDLKTHKTE